MPPTIEFTPSIPPAYVTLVTPVTTQGTTNPLAVTPRSAPVARASLVATHAAPMLSSHPAPAPEGESSRQHHRVTFNPDVSTISSGSESGSGEEPAAPIEH